MKDWPFTPELVEHIHGAILAATGGAPGIRDRRLLEAALARPLASFGGQEFYPSLVEKGAALAHAIVKDHPFVDGNKRTAVVLLETLFRLYGLRLVATDGELEEVMVAVAAGTLDLEGLTAWLRARVRSARW